MPLTTKLSVEPKGDRTLRVTRSFAAPRPVVWRAMTEPDLVKRWLWADDYPMALCEMDVREGGKLRWGWHMPPDSTMWLSGRYLKVEAPGLLVHTELFDQDWTDGETIVTQRLIDKGEATLMDMDILYPSAKGRQTALATPMADGMEQGYVKLDTLLPEWA